MGMKVKFNPKAIEANLSQIGDRATKGMASRMRQVAIGIRDLARSYAPRDTGLLEEHIDYIQQKEGRRATFDVYIDLDASRLGDRGGVLGDYALVMEEQLHPYGRQQGKRYFRLGKGSQAKAAGGIKVGGRFMARAIKEGTKNLEGIMAGEVQRVTGGSRKVPMNYSGSDSWGSDE